jgi:hypothetical protein
MIFLSRLLVFFFASTMSYKPDDKIRSRKEMLDPLRRNCRVWKGRFRRRERRHPYLS